MFELAPYSLQAVGVIGAATLLLAMVFGRRFVIAGTAATVAAMVASALLFDPAEVSRTPPYLFVACVLIVAVALLGVVARDADVLSRETAVIDPLTQDFVALSAVPAKFA